MIYVATGHRLPRLGLKYTEQDELSLAQWTYNTFNQNLALYEGDSFIVGMAGGWDSAVAEACVRFGIPFTAALAFDGQADTWPDDARSRWQGLLSKASEVIIASDGKAENYKYLLRDEMMVNMGDHVIALWDGDKKGGTAYTVKYALKEGLPVTNYWDKWMSRKG